MGNYHKKRARVNYHYFCGNGERVIHIYAIYYILYTIYYILYNILYTIYTIYYITYNVKYILYTIYYINSNDITWLHYWMFYHRLPNLGELLQGNLVSKLRKGFASEEFIDRECKCDLTTKVNGMCACRGECRGCRSVYEVTYKFWGDFYVGNTQNTL